MSGSKSRSDELAREAEFAEWLARCSLDACKKLKLSNLQIAYKLVDEAKKYLDAALMELEDS